MIDMNSEIPRQIRNSEFKKKKKKIFWLSLNVKQLVIYEAWYLELSEIVLTGDHSLLSPNIWNFILYNKNCF